jgi:uncharacterized protein
VWIEPNPYTNRGTILKPEDFFGRVEQLEDIYKRIIGGQSVSIIGERRIGKSSLLNAISFERENYDLPGTFHFVFLDLQSIAGCTEDFFLEFLIDVISENTKQSPEGTGRRALWKMAHLRSKKERLIVLLDELDALTQNDRIFPDLFAFLRSWSTQCAVPLIVAFREGSIERIAEDEKTGSPFLNMFGSVYLGPLEKQEAEELIATPSQSHGISFSDEEVEKILDLSGYFPLLLQIACYHMFELRQSSRISSEWKRELEDRFTSEAINHFEYSWSRLSRSEQALLHELDTSRKSEERMRDAWKTLVQKGIVISDGEKSRMFSTAFEMFVRNRTTVETASGGLAQSLKKSLFE